MRCLSVDKLLERAASIANLAMLRTYSEPSSLQIAAINEYTPLLESNLRSLPPHYASTRDRILAQLDIHRSLLAPIRRLPKELLINIFFLVASESPLRTLYVAVTFARVCAVWRAVAHGLTQLWTRLVVESLSDFDQYCELFLPLTGERLSDIRCDEPRILGPLWDGIELYASCWRSVTLGSPLSVLPDLKVLYMENLERLTVDAYDAPLSVGLSALDFVVAPRLRHIALTLDELQSECQLHVPVTRALTSLEITSISPFSVALTLPLLRACANTLQSLTIRIRSVSEGVDKSYLADASGMLVMHALTYLSLADTACALLNQVTAPLVQQLVLSNVPVYGSRSLLAFLARGQASQSLLVLRVYQAKEREMSAWIPCLQLTDKLLQLHFDELLSNREFLERLIRREDRPTLLPSLKGFAIVHIFRTHPELHGVIGDLLGSRERETVFRGRRAWVTLRWIRDVFDSIFD
ncbi:hypothetical protein EV122DRAFT_222123 [Schizophyllum commune]